MPNTITGRVLSIGQPLQLAGRDPSRPFIKREIVIDCTRHDPYTGERSQYENTPLLEFAGESCRDLDNFAVGDIVTITFSIEGSRYRDKTTREEKIFTRVRPYRIEKRQPVQPQPVQPVQPAPPVQQTQQTPQPAPQPAPQQPYYAQMPPDFPPPYAEAPF